MGPWGGPATFDLGPAPRRDFGWPAIASRSCAPAGDSGTTFDDTNPRVPSKGSIKVSLRGPIKGSIGF